jgi:hypothetical protein
LRSLPRSPGWTLGSSEAADFHPEVLLFLARAIHARRSWLEKKDVLTELNSFHSCFSNLFIDRKLANLQRFFCSFLRASYPQFPYVPLMQLFQEEN